MDYYSDTKVKGTISGLPATAHLEKCFPFYFLMIQCLRIASFGLIGQQRIGLFQLHATFAHRIGETPVLLMVMGHCRGECLQRGHVLFV